MKIFKETSYGGSLPPAAAAPASPAERNTAVTEKLITLKAAAAALGLPSWKLSRAANHGVFPTYGLLNSRRLVKLTEVSAAVEASRQGGGA